MPTDAGRAAAAAVLAIALAELWLPLTRDRNRGRFLAWMAAGACFLTPPLLAGYVYANVALTALGASSVVRHLLYMLLLICRYAPLALLLRVFYRSPISSEGAFCAALPHAPSAWRTARMAMRRFGPFWFGAWAVVFLFAFSDMEMASLLYVETWTVRLFDAQAGGLMLTESLRKAAGPLTIQLLAMGAGVLALRRSCFALDSRTDVGSTAAPRRFAAWATLSGSVLLTTGAPVASLFDSTGLDPMVFGTCRALTPDMARSAFLAAAAAILSTAAARWLSTSRHAARNALFAAVPGLLGGLVLGLFLLTLFTLPALRSARHTPLPVLLGLILLLMPFLLVSQFILAVGKPATALHSANLLRHASERSVRRAGAHIASALWGNSQSCVLAIAFALAYVELTLSAILAPAGLSLISMRLYNLMHYGRSTVLSMMVLIALAAPFLLAATGAIFYLARCTVSQENRA